MTHSRKKHLLLAVLLLSLLCLLTACGEQEGQKSSEYVYVPEYHKLTADFDSIEYVTYGSDGSLYFSTYGVTERKETLTEQETAQYMEWYGELQDWMYEVYGNQIYRTDIEGTEMVQLENYRPLSADLGPSAYGSLTGLYATDDGNLLVLENVYQDVYEGNEWISSTNNYYLRVLDSTGKEVSQTLLNDLFEGEEYINFTGLAVGQDGNIYLGGSNGVYVISSTGEPLFTLETEQWVDGIYCLSDGRVAVMSWKDSGEVLTVVDTEAKAWGEDISVPSNAWQIYPCEGDYDFLYNDSSTLMGYNIASDTSEEVLNWIDCDVDNNNVRTMSLLPDGRIFCAVQTYTQDGSEWEFVLLTKTKASEVPQKTEITLAAYYLYEDLRSQIIEFNKTNPEYRIVVEEYEKYNTEDDYTAGLNKLTTEISSGKIPDLLIVDSLPIEQYAANGMLEDLWPWIDQDEELSREDLVPSVFAALETDGKLCQISSGFTVNSLIGSSSVLGTEMGWTTEKLNEFLDAHPETQLNSYWTKDNALLAFGLMNIDNFIDWTTGECSFDSQEFVQLLEFANRFPAEINWNDSEYVDDYQLIQEGKILFYPFSLYSLSDYNMYKALFGGEVTFIGYPTSEGVGNYISLDSGLAMSASCKNKEGAWSFMRTLLTEEYQKDNYSLPTNMNLLNKQLEEAMSPEKADSTWTMGGNGYEITVSEQLTQADVDKIMELINSVSGVYAYNQSVFTIIQEEAAAYFAGQKSAEDTAAQIQSRMNIYVNEQK